MQLIRTVILGFCCLTNISAQEKCNEPSWKCRNSRCIWSGGRCNGYDNCGDNSDEQNCKRCNKYAWKCSNNQCIMSWKRCDGYDDCGDNSDEQNCTCHADQWKCSNNQCITMHWRCDGQEDCRDGSDEMNCDQWRCPAGGDWWQCRNKQCVKTSRRCDGKRFYDHDEAQGCRDDSDEENCDQWTCPSGGKWWQCKNKHCIPTSGRCDKYRTCHDKSDEEDCDEWTCPAGGDWWQCRNKQCIQTPARCDGYPHCRDDSDEDCDSAVIESLTLNNTDTSNTVTGADGVTVYLTCRVFGQPAPYNVTISKDINAFTSRHSQYQKTGTLTSEAVLTLSDVQCRDMGTYTCTADNGFGDPDTKRLRLNVTCPPKKLSVQILKSKGITFKLEAYPIPKSFVFSHLGVSVAHDRFVSECTQDVGLDYFMECLIVPHKVPEGGLGLYTVAVSNELGSVDINFNIRKEDRAVVKSLALNNTHETVTVTGDERVSLHLTCTLSGRPLPEHVTITRGFFTFSSRDILYQRTGKWTKQAVLTLSEVQCHDMGTYTCTAHNGIVGPDTKEILLNVKCPPSKLFYNVTMEARRMSFQLASYPVPDQFVFVHLGNQTSSVGTDVSHRFTAECHQDPVTEYIVHCEVILLAAPQDVTGLYRAEVYNDLGKVDFFFNVQPDDSTYSYKTNNQTADDGKYVFGAVGGLLIIFIIVVVAVVFWRKRDQIFKTTRSPRNRISGLYVEIEELPLTMRHQPHPLHGPVQQRPLPQPPSAALTVSSPAHQQSQQDPLQARSLPRLPPGCGDDTSSPASLTSVQTHKANADGSSGVGDDYNELTQGRQPTCQDTTYSHTNALV